MDDQTARRLHRLLARGRLSRTETDAIRESVLDAIERKEKRPGRVIRFAYWRGAAVAAAAAVLLVVYGPRGPGGDVRVHVPESGDMPVDAVLEVRCSGGKRTACPASSEIVFSLSGKRALGFLSAYAVSAQGAGRSERVVRLSSEHRLSCRPLERPERTRAR